MYKTINRDAGGHLSCVRCFIAQGRSKHTSCSHFGKYSPTEWKIPEIYLCHIGPMTWWINGH